MPSAVYRRGIRTDRHHRLANFCRGGVHVFSDGRARRQLSAPADGRDAVYLLRRTGDVAAGKLAVRLQIVGRSGLPEAPGRRFGDPARQQDHGNQTPRQSVGAAVPARRAVRGGLRHHQQPRPGPGGKTADEHHQRHSDHHA
ncbi:hypothetical protein D3C72_1207910 [compost metagenome]